MFDLILQHIILEFLSAFSELLKQTQSNVTCRSPVILVCT